MNRIILGVCLAVSGMLSFSTVEAKEFEVRGGRASLVVEDGLRPVAYAAEEMLRKDWKAVFGRDVLSIGEGPRIVACTAGSEIVKKYKKELKQIEGRSQAFVMLVSRQGDLYVVGSDSHGVAYGLMELSRRMGVSPWEWWADCAPRQLKTLRMDEGVVCAQWPSVEFRGIFINDEDWGLTPWSWQTNDPAEKGVVGPKTTERIFQLLLRLRANAYWPPMHGCSKPFFLTDGNREVAKRYGIYIGTSHCEPMACNANGEWKVRAAGKYDYASNRQEVSRFWESRVRDVAEQEIVYTLGMRGEHDSPMLGAKTPEARKELTEKVIADQREMLSKCLGRKAEEIPQVFIPYKEVLDIYNMGMDLPDDVTLMWCDDNYGYIRHFPTEKEQARKGGNGVYYHASYWGRPHDYLWLGTFSPSLLMEQMSEAYRSGIRKMWILNVGDIKPLEYQTELFMDLAWDFDGTTSSGVRKHLESFLAREFGGENASRLASDLMEHYRLAYVSKPEYMGNTRTEEKDPKYSVITDMPWDESYVRQRLADYERISEDVQKVGAGIPQERATAYFHLVGYPVLAAAQQNKKLLTAQLARHGKAAWEEVRAAYDSIQSMTAKYNVGKWKGMMDSAPRRLPVFGKVPEVESEGAWAELPKALLTLDGQDDNTKTVLPAEGLGHGGRAAALSRGKRASYEFTLEKEMPEGIDIELRLLPSHPMDADGKLEIEVSVDGGAPSVIDYHTEGRSEEWKLNVLRNQALRTVSLPDVKSGRHEVAVKAISRGVVIDQIAVFVKR